VVSRREQNSLSIKREGAGIIGFPERFVFMALALCGVRIRCAADPELRDNAA
jgi:hypothetical protein